MTSTPSREERLAEALRKARQWVEANTAQVRDVSPEAAKPGEAMLHEIDATLSPVETAPASAEAPKPGTEPTDHEI